MQYKVARISSRIQSALFVLSIHERIVHSMQTREGKVMKS